MFDIGFTELLLCLIVGLVVIGPEQLPGTVRTVALWIGRLKRSLAETRSEIERQIGADDIRRQLHNEEILRNIEETRLQIEASIREHGLLEHTQTDNNDAKPSAADYGPPEELPDHAHGNDDSLQPAVKSVAAAPVATNPAPAATTPPAPANTPASPATAVNQVSPAVAPAPIAAPSEPEKASIPPATGTSH